VPRTATRSPFLRRTEQHVDRALAHVTHTVPDATVEDEILPCSCTASPTART
jgi:hypothetical protein